MNVGDRVGSKGGEEGQKFEPHAGWGVVVAEFRMPPLSDQLLRGCEREDVSRNESERKCILQSLLDLHSSRNREARTSQAYAGTEIVPLSPTAWRRT